MNFEGLPELDKYGRIVVRNDYGEIINLIPIGYEDEPPVAKVTFWQRVIMVYGVLTGKA